MHGISPFESPVEMWSYVCYDKYNENNKGLCLMKTYTIVAGVNGCGKSSLIGILTTERDDLGTVIDENRIAASCSGNLLEGGKRAAL